MLPFLIIGVLGLAVGRFLVPVIRSQLEQAVARSILSPRPTCGCPPAPADYVPVLWWVLRRGACSSVRRSAGPLYRLVEPVTAAAWVGAQWVIGGRWTLAAYLWMVTVTVVLGFIDLKSHRLPNRVLGPGTAVGFLLLTGGALLEGQVSGLVEALLTGLGYFVALLIPALLTRGAIGMGDVKLAFLLGLFAGYHGWETAVSALVSAFLLAGAAGVLLLANRRITRRDHLPFGPFLVAGAWFAIVWTLAGSTGVT